MVQHHAISMDPERRLSEIHEKNEAKPNPTDLGSVVTVGCSKNNFLVFSLKLTLQSNAHVSVHI